jgi:hypothetical protein
LVQPQVWVFMVHVAYRDKKLSPCLCAFFACIALPQPLPKSQRGACRHQHDQDVLQQQQVYHATTAEVSASRSGTSVVLARLLMRDSLSSRLNTRTASSRAYLPCGRLQMCCQSNVCASLDSRSSHHWTPALWSRCAQPLTWHSLLS